MSKLQTIKLKNSHGMEVDLLNLGARIGSIKYPVAGKLVEMLLTYQGYNKYQLDPFYLGATVGRVSNRISKSSFTLKGTNYSLMANDGKNCLHGGPYGMSHRLWSASLNPQSHNSVIFSLLSPDKDQGFPGELSVTVEYSLNDCNELLIVFNATSSSDTVVALCNHAYFTLGEKNVEQLELKLDTLGFLPIDEQMIPTGEVSIDSLFDFSKFQKLGEMLSRIRSSGSQYKKGYDHCYILNKPSLKTTSATLISKLNQVKLSISTSQPGLQLYTGGHLFNEFSPYQAVCLEAQALPNAVNQQNFPSIFLRAGDLYQEKVVYKFENLLK
mgnify:CR=1 FL=1